MLITFSNSIDYFFNRNSDRLLTRMHDDFTYYLNCGRYFEDLFSISVANTCDKILSLFSLLSDNSYFRSQFKRLRISMIYYGGFFWLRCETLRSSLIHISYCFHRFSCVLDFRSGFSFIS